MAGITYLRGDATNPLASGQKIIAHVCNDIGKWGRGFVMALSKKWPVTRREYLSWYNKKEIDGNKFELGGVQLVQVRPDICVANMIGQHGIKTGSKGPPIRYPAVQSALEKIADHALKTDASVHMPRIGCGLAGGKWEEIEPLIQNLLVKRGIPVYVYDLG